MSIAHEFEYLKPTSLDEAVEMMARHGRDAQVLAGGTDLIGWMREDLATPGVVLDIKGIDGLAEIVVRGGVLSVGALTTFSQLLNSEPVRETLPLISEMAGTVGSVGVRNRATMVGNICSAVPSCDSGPTLLVYEGRVMVTGPSGARTIPIDEWFTGPKETVLGAGEIVTGIEIPIPPGPHGGCYVKLRRLRGEDLAQASVAVLALPGNVYRVAFGAVAPTPVRGSKIEALLEGRELDDSLIREASALIPEETSPITDIRSSGEYRAHILRVMFERGVRAAVQRREGQGPEYGAALI